MLKSPFQALIVLPIIIASKRHTLLRKQGKSIELRRDLSPILMRFGVLFDRRKTFQRLFSTGDILKKTKHPTYQGTAKIIKLYQMRHIKTKSALAVSEPLRNGICI